MLSTTHSETHVLISICTPQKAYPRFHDAILSTKYFDDESKLAYFGFRYYSPNLGRWISRDPLGEYAGENVVAFVQNQPTGTIDPFGLWRLPWPGRPRPQPQPDPKPTKQSCCSDTLSRLMSAEPFKTAIDNLMTVGWRKPNKQCLKMKPQCVDCSKLRRAPGDTGGELGHYSPNNLTINLCWNNMSDFSQGSIESILRHELQHAYTTCGGRATGCPSTGSQEGYQCCMGRLLDEMQAHMCGGTPECQGLPTGTPVDQWDTVEWGKFVTCATLAAASVPDCVNRYGSFSPGGDTILAGRLRSWCASSQPGSPRDGLCRVGDKSCVVGPSTP